MCQRRQICSLFQENSSTNGKKNAESSTASTVVTAANVQKSKKQKSNRQVSEYSDSSKIDATFFEDAVVEEEIEIECTNSAVLNKSRFDY